MKIALSGSNGFIGSHLSGHLRAAGHSIIALSRSKSDANNVLWNSRDGVQELEKLEGLDAVIHLAGENIVARWTAAKKKRIYDSRVTGTKALVDSLKQLKAPPQTLICASGVGYYGSRGDEALTEQSTNGDDFLARVCRDWEAEAKRFEEAGGRVVSLRLGMVLSKYGGALAAMLPAFKLGVGGRIGDGKQFISWISLEDLLLTISYVLQESSISGPINCVSPTPLSNQEFTKILARQLSRPSIIPAPAFMVKLVLGEVAEALLLSSAKALPEKLHDSGFSFKHTQLELALKDILSKE